jgi:hypothetical protein
VSNNIGKVCFAVVLTLIRNYSLVSTTPVSDAFTVLESFTGVNNTIEEFFTASIHPTTASSNYKITLYFAGINNGRIEYLRQY